MQKSVIKPIEIRPSLSLRERLIAQTSKRDVKVFVGWNKCI